MRLAIHDYAGHPFQFELSKALSQRGHTVRHFYFAGDPGPKGATDSFASESETYSVTGVQLTETYHKDRLFKRWFLDNKYGRRAAQEIADFRPDLIISGNTPIDAQRILLGAARKHNSKFVFWMQDVISPLMMRHLRSRMFGLGSVIAKRYQDIERKLVEESDAVVLISHDFEEILSTLSIRPKRQVVIPNWGALDSIPLRSHDNPWSREHNLHGKTVLLYSGTLGTKHNPIALAHLADDLNDDERVLILVAAVGAGAEALKRELERKPRSNLVLMSLQPMEAFPDMLGSADIVIALLEHDAGQFSVPSKILSYLCAGRPIVLFAPKENLASRIVASSGAGRTVDAGDYPGLLRAVQELVQDSSERERVGSLGRRYAERHFNIEQISDKFEKLFMECSL